MLTRLLTSTLLGLSWGRINPLWPLPLFFNHVVGAALKSSINFRFNRQKWTRQGISSLEAADPRKARQIRRESAALHVASLLALVAAVSFATGALGVPDRSEEHTSELQSLMRITSHVCCMNNKKHTYKT